jgi:hypothetical protein
MRPVSLHHNHASTRWTRLAKKSRFDSPVDLSIEGIGAFFHLFSAPR